MNLSSITNHRWVAIFRQALTEWMNDNVLRLSAALAYYSIFSVAPLLVIAVIIAGQVMGQEAASGQLYTQLKEYVGSSAADTLQSMVKSAYRPGEGILATAFAFVTLLVGASGVFGQLKDALNTIFDADTETRQGIWGFIVGKLLSVSMVLVIGFLLLVSLVVSTAIAALNNVLESMFTLPAFCWTILTSIISWMMVSSLFAMIFKVLPDTRVSWRSVWIGAAVSGLLFEVGKTGLGWYLGRESLSSAYGAAGSIVLLLMWVYYNSCILFFGAELAHAHAQARKKKSLPAA